jgi:protoporphyrinogen IX oxidase
MLNVQEDFVQMRSAAHQMVVIELPARNHAMVAWTLVGHIFGLVLWMTGLLMASVVLMRYSRETSEEARRTLARMGRISLRGFADPGALLTLAAGIMLVSTNRSYYLHAGWLHIKLVFVVVLIGMHVLVAIRNKVLASGTGSISSNQAKMLFVVVIVVFLLILIATLPGEVFLT